MDSKKKKLILSIVLTGITFIAELVGGLLTGSLALLSDSAHVFMDMFALGISYLAIRAASLPANDRHTYGYHRFQVIAALVNGVSLFVIAIEILRGAIERFQNPEPVLAGPMLIIALIGLAVNVTVALVLRPHGDHDHDDLNTRSAFLHVVGDTLASVGVILAGIIILLTGQQWVDPLVSLLISLLILFSAGRLLLKTVHILVEGMPEGMRASDVAEAMQSMEGVVQIHDLHIWTVGPEYIALSAHVILTDQMLSQSEGVMAELKEILSSRYHIDHTTIQFECATCGQGKVNHSDDSKLVANGGS